MAGPFIDPSVMLLDPQFTDKFSVIRRVQLVNNFGEVSTTNTQTDNVLGVVTPAKPADLRRLDDNERGHRSLVIFTRTRLNDAAQKLNTTPPTQRQPDLVLWGSDTFIVKECLPWTKYGPGWVKVLVTSIDSIEAIT